MPLDLSWVKPEMKRSLRRLSDWDPKGYPVSLTKELTHLRVQTGANPFYRHYENACGKTGRRYSFYIEGVTCLLCLFSNTGKRMMKEAEAVGCALYDLDV
jgi:hypothetical protein